MTEGWLLGITGSIVVGLVTSFFASWITVRLSLGRFHSERWWERKLDAYTAIVESLYHLLNYYHEDMADQFGEREHVPEDRVKALKAKYQQAEDDLSKAVDIGSFIIANEAVSRLKELRTERWKAEGEINKTILSSLDMDEVQTSLIRKCLQSFIEIAQRDLDVYRVSKNRLKSIRGILNRRNARNLTRDMGHKMGEAGKQGE